MSDFDPDTFLAENNSSDFNPDDFLNEGSANQPHQGFFHGLAKSAIDSLPVLGGVAGGILGTPADVVAGPMGNIAGAGIGGYLGTAAKNLINSYYDPKNAPKTMTETLTQPLIGGVEQGLAQGAGEAVAPYVAKGINAVASPIGSALKSFGAKKAVAATGATGRQAMKFAPEAGQELLDRGIVKFGDSQTKIAQKAGDALEQSGNQIGNILSDLDKKGVTVDHSDIINSLRSRAAELAKKPSQFSVSDSLNKLADRMQTMIDAGGGQSTIPVSEGEAIKREFQASANYNSSPHDLSVSKEAANIYRQAVENAASKADPEAAKAFVQNKKDYQLLNPIQDAAQKRASTLNQSPHGGLLDTAAIIAGEGLAGAPGAVVAPIARRAISSRIASSTAGSANTLGNIFKGAPRVAQATPATVQQLASQAQSPILEAGANRLSSLPAAAQNGSQQQPNRVPAKGPDAWAQKGINNLGIQDPDLQQRLLSDPKAKQLLIQASDLPAGSKAAKKLMNQITSKWGNK